MKQDFLASLVCPDCRSEFELDSVYNRTGKEIHNAITRCRCGEYPVINGILIYKKPSFQAGMASTGYIIERLRMGLVDEASALPVKVSDREKMLLDLQVFLTSLAGSRRIFNPILRWIRSSRRKTLQKISRSPSFFDIINLLEPNTWGAYLKHRFSSQTFWSCYPFIPLIEKKNNKVLDMGCGAGHLSFVLSRHMRPENLVCADENYTLLLLAKRFMVRDANFVCLDANNPLPFSDDLFSSVVMMDSMHYISNRALLAGELLRILSRNGLLLQLHLHNSLKNNMSRGFAMTPESWSGLFPESSPFVMPETPLLRDFLSRSEMDLIRTYSKDSINNADAIALVITEDKKLFNKYPNLQSLLEKSLRNPIINPIYESHRKNVSILLERRAPNRMYAEEYPLSMSFLPRRYTIPPNIARSIGGRKVGRLDGAARSDGTFRDMIRKFIVIDAPRGYI
jgi:SAM-dependent methyltransferase/uncharacterized protein YbaR (Trm112 family)